VKATASREKKKGFYLCGRPEPPFFPFIYRPLDRGQL
jgi:hypothetical protein